MEKVPLYLQWFFIRIRNHSYEEDYFVKRFDNMSREKMLIETQMIGELHKRGLILLSDKRANKVFDPLVFTDSNGIIVHRAGTEHHVPYPTWFGITPQGKYLWIESTLSLTSTLAWTIAVAAISGFVGSKIG